jgi:hypothetical protein
MRIDSVTASGEKQNGQARCLAVSIYVDGRRKVSLIPRTHHTAPFKGRELQQTARLYNLAVQSLLLDESIVSPEAFRIAIARIDEFHVMSDDAHNAETRILRCRDALIAREEFLHLLLFASLRVLIGGVELILRQAAISIRFELDGLLRLDHRVLGLHR